MGKLVAIQHNPIMLTYKSVIVRYSPQMFYRDRTSNGRTAER